MADIYKLFGDPKMVFNLELLLRILLGGFMGAIIGHERKSRDKSAGMRTHAIVGLGAALIMIVSKYGFGDVPDFDASRVAAQIVSGVGFLGAGIIFVRNNATVSGLTTAAGIWTTAGVGMALGAGIYFIGISAGFLVVVIQILLHRIRFLSAEPTRGYMKIATDQFENVSRELQDYLGKDHVKLLSLKVSKGKENTKIELELLYPPGYEKQTMLNTWAKDSRIHSISG